ncbi:MAG: hypothetical protein IKB71_09300, partial [Lentisphaeria bacterium]|nr:hypothetical protein [Lentisphaeria bacterium]
PLIQGSPRRQQIKRRIPPSPKAMARQGNAPFFHFERKTGINGKKRKENMINYHHLLHIFSPKNSIISHPHFID